MYQHLFVLTRINGAWRDVNVCWFDENLSMAILNDWRGKRGYNKTTLSNEGIESIKHDFTCFKTLARCNKAFPMIETR